MRIYCVTNHTNGKKYVGCTNQTLEQRFIEHSYSPKSALGQAMQADGKDQFSIELLEEFPGLIDKDREGFWIDKLNTLRPFGYNINPMLPNEAAQPKGRPRYPAGKLRKKNRGISMTESEFRSLIKLAEAAGMGISEYVISKCGLS